MELLKVIQNLWIEKVSETLPLPLPQPTATATATANTSD
jgi:hypothetical protein